MKAWLLIREGPHYRRHAFQAGLEAAGYRVQTSAPERAQPGDVLVIWNRYGQFDKMAERFSQAGGQVVVAENPYLGLKDARGEPAGYAMSLDGHNGSGQWFPRDDGGDRFHALGLAVQPWQDNPQGHLLICGQRGIGSPTMASPPDWHGVLARHLASRTRRRLLVRPHPEGPGKPSTTLEQDMAGAWAALIWSSSSGLQALLRGIPVFYAAPHWIGAPGALRLWPIDSLETPLRSDDARMTALREMAWAQWSLDEITSGSPFRHLLQRCP